MLGQLQQLQGAVLPASITSAFPLSFPQRLSQIHNCLFLFLCGYFTHCVWRHVWGFPLSDFVPAQCCHGRELMVLLSSSRIVTRFLLP